MKEKIERVWNIPLPPYPLSNKYSFIILNRNYTIFNTSNPIGKESFKSAIVLPATAIS
jgi:hypothetical protein